MNIMVFILHNTTTTTNDPALRPYCDTHTHTPGAIGQCRLIFSVRRHFICLGRSDGPTVAGHLFRVDAAANRALVSVVPFWWDHLNDYE